ncbi:MAG: hypothetical protein IJ217_02725 [Clostridia bacterium]|nr:hypothetical protein [Clostridia bacterium]
MKVILCLILLFSLTACTQEHSEVVPQDNTNIEEIGEIDGNSDLQQYSKNTLIISVDVAATKDEVMKLFEEYHLEIIYDYENFNMYAVKTERDMSIEELDNLIAELESNEYVLSAEKDSIIQLDEPVNLY